MAEHGELKKIIEVGRAVLADRSDVFMVYVDVTALEVANDKPEDPVVPLGVFVHTENGYNLALLAAWIVAERYPENGSAIVLPEEFHEDIKWNANIGEGEAEGNVGTISDDINIKILGADGRVLS